MKSGATLKVLAVALLMLATISSWAQEVKSTKPKGVKTPKGWVYIPQGQLVMDKDTTRIEAFYMLETEISNLDYREYILWLKSNNKTEELAIAQVDSAKWSTPNAYNQPFVDYYFNHPAYNQYPVVNISYEAAQLYCKWLTDRLKQTVKGMTVEAVLPTRAQWIWAARGGIFNSPYSITGANLKNHQREITCNYFQMGDESIHYNAEKKCYEVIDDLNEFIQSDNSSNITAPVKSFFKNNYGLYNMNGNVAEMVSEKGVAMGGSWKSPGYDVRNESSENYTGSCTTVGFRPILKFTVQ